MIIPIYNVEKYVNEMIQSLKIQKINNIEFLLINDGSTDKTSNIIENAIGSDKRFKHIITKNNGVSAARNLGLKQSKGKYVLFLDSDDYLCDNAILNLYRRALETNADITYGKIKRFDKKKSWYVQGHVEVGLNSLGEKDILNNPELFNSIGPGAKLFKKNLLVGTKFPEDIIFGEDQVVSFYAYINSKKIVSINEDVYMYRVRESENSSTQLIRKKSLRYLSDLLIVSKINLKTIMKNEDYSEEEKKNITVAYFERLLRFEVYPIIKAGIRKRSSQKEIMKLTQQWLEMIPQNVKSDMTGLVEYLLIDLNLYLFILKSNNILLLSKLTEEISFVDQGKWSIERQANYCEQMKYRKVFLNAQRIKQYNIRLSSLVNFFYRKKNIGNKISALIFYLSKLLPLKKDLVVFCDSKSLDENENLLFLYKESCLNNKLDVRYLQKFNEGIFQNYKKYYLLSRAQVIIVDNYFYPLYSKKIRKKQFYIQVWHAAGAYKKFGHSALTSWESKSEQFETRAHRQYTHIIASSKEVGDIYSAAFMTSRDKIQTIGFPRTDKFFSEEHKRKIKKKFFLKYPCLINKKIIIYAPTFRGHDNNRKKAIKDINWKKVNLDKESVVITKYHPLVKEVPLKTNNKQVINANEDVDFSTLDLVIVADILITDYSSIIFDYSLLEKPLITYISDLTSYENERGLYYPMSTYTYDLVASNENELSNCISKGLEPNRHRESLDDFREKFMSSCDGDAGKKFQDLLNQLTK